MNILKRNQINNIKKKENNLINTTVNAGFYPKIELEILEIQANESITPSDYSSSIKDTLLKNNQTDDDGYDNTFGSTNDTIFYYTNYETGSSYNYKYYIVIGEYLWSRLDSDTSFVNLGTNMDLKYPSEWSDQGSDYVDLSSRNPTFYSTGGKVSNGYIEFGGSDFLLVNRNDYNNFISKSSRTFSFWFKAGTETEFYVFKIDLTYDKVYDNHGSKEKMYQERHSLKLSKSGSNTVLTCYAYSLFQYTDSSGSYYYNDTRELNTYPLTATVSNDAFDGNWHLIIVGYDIFDTKNPTISLCVDDDEDVSITTVNSSSSGTYSDEEVIGNYLYTCLNYCGLNDLSGSTNIYPTSAFFGEVDIEKTWLESKGYDDYYNINIYGSKILKMNDLRVYRMFSRHPIYLRNNLYNNGASNGNQNSVNKNGMLTITLPTITGTVTNVLLYSPTTFIDGTDGETTFDITDGTHTDTNLSMNTKTSLVNLTGVPTSIELNIKGNYDISTGAPTTEFGSTIDKYVLMLWKE